MPRIFTPISHYTLKFLRDTAKDNLFHEMILTLCSCLYHMPDSHELYKHFGITKKSLSRYMESPPSLKLQDKWCKFIIEAIDNEIMFRHEVYIARVIDNV